MLKEMSYTLSKLYDVELLHRQALKLRTYIEDALYPYIALQDCLVVDMERIEDTPTQLRRKRRGHCGLMLLPELPRGDLIPFFERTDQVAAG